MNIGYVCKYARDFVEFRRANEKTHNCVWIQGPEDFVGVPIDIIIHGTHPEDRDLAVNTYIDAWERFTGHQPKKEMKTLWQRRTTITIDGKRLGKALINLELKDPDESE